MENKEKDQLQKAWVVVVCFSLLFALFVLSSCKTQTVVVEKIKHDSVYINTLQHDSIWMHDSIWLDTRVSHDTVYKTKIETHTDYRYRYLHDTTAIVKVDSIPYPVEVVKEVKYRSGFDKFCVSFFVLFILSTIVLGAWLIFKKFYLKR